MASISSFKSYVTQHDVDFVDYGPGRRVCIRLGLPCDYKVTTTASLVPPPRPNMATPANKAKQLKPLKIFPFQ